MDALPFLRKLTAFEQVRERKRIAIPAVVVVMMALVMRLFDAKRRGGPVSA